MNSKTIFGTVDKICGLNTVRISFQERIIHPIYKKKYTQTRTYKVHVVGNMPIIGDKIEIQECKPISKTKNWMMVTSNNTKKETAVK
jgi:small subunit ribosomal protein S17